MGEVIGPNCIGIIGAVVPVETMVLLGEVILLLPLDVTAAGLKEALVGEVDLPVPIGIMATDLIGLTDTLLEEVGLLYPIGITVLVCPSGDGGNLGEIIPLFEPIGTIVLMELLLGEPQPQEFSEDG